MRTISGKQRRLGKGRELATLEVTPDEYKFDVKAYAVLSHAAMEQAFEDVCEIVADITQSEYKRNGTILRSALSLLAFIGAHMSVKAEEKTMTLNPRGDHLQAIGTSVKEFKNTFILRNHGMSCKYLMRLFTPVALSETPDIDELDAINQLKDIRGDFAHRYQAQIVADPKVTKQHVGFCHRYFERIAREAANLIGEVL